MNNVLRCRIAQPTSGADGVKIAVLRKDRERLWFLWAAAHRKH
jgi:hypothetical protein